VLGCAECGLEYSSPGWIDAVIPDKFWLEISPTGHGGGILCINCMSRLLTEKRIYKVPMKIESGAFVCDSEKFRYRIMPFFIWQILNKRWFRKKRLYIFNADG